MSISPATDIRRWHAENASALAEAEVDLDASRAREAEAQARKAEARLLLAAATARRTELEKRVEVLSRSLGESRYALSRLCMAALPDDVLRCMFEEAVRDQYDAAFALAEVCAKWRRVALGSRTLWSRIAPPILNEDNVDRRPYRRVVQMLSRSHTAPLYVALRIYMSRTQRSIDWNHKLEAVRSMLSAVNRHARRWAEVSFRFSSAYLSDADWEKLRPLEGLKGPTPLLTSVGLTLRRGATLHPDGEYLPFAPALRTLAQNNLGLACSAQSAFPSLIDIDLYGRSFIYSELYEFLVHAPALKMLSMRDLHVSLDDEPRGKLSLPSLEFLELGSGSETMLFCQPAAYLPRTPKLAELCFCGVPEDALVPFLMSVSPTVLRLSIGGGRLSEQHVDVFRHLQRVESLVVESDSGDRGGIQDDPVFDLLSSPSPAIWPRLIRISTPYLPMTEEMIMRLILSRNPPPASGAQGVPPNAAGQPCSSLTRVELGGDEPDWLREEIDRLLL